MNDALPHSASLNLTPPSSDRGCKIVLTGGPGGGKTTASDLFRRELGERVAIVPEAATLLFTGGFPRSLDDAAGRAVQRAIYHVQTNLEDVQQARFPERILLCDRGTVDGAAYWPPDHGADFFSSVGTSLAAELARYDAVIFFESAAVGGLGVIEDGNPARIESVNRAAQLDQRLREVWQQHARFVLVPHAVSFMDKIVNALQQLTRLVTELTAAG